MATRQEMIRAVQGITPYLTNHVAMSYFDKHIKYTTPGVYCVSVSQVADMILHNENLRIATERFRTTRNEEDKLCLPHVTTGFICADRHENSLLVPSGLHAIDFDHLPESIMQHPVTGDLVDLVEIIKYEIMTMDPYCLLAYRSPSGNGVKAFVWRPLVGNMPPVEAHREMHKALNGYYQNKIGNKYGVKVDEHGENIAHAAFLAYDCLALTRENLTQYYSQTQSDTALQMTQSA